MLVMDFKRLQVYCNGLQATYCKMSQLTIKLFLTFNVNELNIPELIRAVVAVRCTTCQSPDRDFTPTCNARASFGEVCTLLRSYEYDFHAKL